MMKNDQIKFFNENGKPEVLLQAVIIADLFDEKLSPISQAKSVCLMPVANKCAIDYAIEMLLYSGLQKIMIVVSRHSDQVMAHIKESSYFKNDYAEFEIVRLNPSTCHSIGDALRELDRDPRSHLRGEFIIVSGVTIGKLNLRRSIERHLQRRYRDDRIVLTALFNRRHPESPLKDSNHDIVLVSDPNSGEILHVDFYDHKRFPILTRSMTERPSVDVQFDLTYSGIYYLDVRALQLFSDNFDFTNVDEFIRNVIGDEVLQRAVCFDVVGNEYLGSVVSFKHYHSISFDVIRRWTYPATPDRSGCSLHKDHIYLAQESVVNQTAILRNDVVIGANSIVGHKAKLERCIIGSDCYIGSNVVIKDSVIWNRVKIEAHCIISNSIICDDAIILQNTEVSKGCILSFKVVVGPATILPERTVVHRPSSTIEVISAPTVVDLGEGAKGSVYTVSDADLPHYEWGLPLLHSRKKSRLNEESKDKPVDSEYDFHLAIKDSVIFGINERVSLETIITEINVSKHLFNVSIDQVVHTVCNTMVEYCFPSSTNDLEEVMNHIKARSEQMAPFCKRYFYSQQLLSSLLQHLEDHLYHSEPLKQLYSRLLLQLYCHDIVDLSFLSIWMGSEAEADSDRKQFRLDRIQGLLDWIKARGLDSVDSEDDDSPDTNSE